LVKKFEASNKQTIIPAVRHINNNNPTAIKISVENILATTLIHFESATSDDTAIANPDLYRGCQKNVPIEDRFSATNPYTAIIFSEHYYDKRYKMT